MLHGAEVTLNLSRNLIDDSNNEINFPRKLLLLDRQIPRVHKTLANNSLPNIKLLKTQVSEIVQLRRYLGRRFCQLQKTGVPLMKNVLRPLAKSILIPLRLTTAVSAANAGICKTTL